jgi:hypothetical protein
MPKRPKPSDSKTTPEAAYAVLERGTIHQRTMAGLAVAHSQGRIGGRPTVMASTSSPPPHASHAVGAPPSQPAGFPGDALPTRRRRHIEAEYLAAELLDARQPWVVKHQQGRCEMSPGDAAEGGVTGAPPVVSDRELRRLRTRDVADCPGDQPGEHRHQHPCGDPDHDISPFGQGLPTHVMAFRLQRLADRLAEREPYPPASWSAARGVEPGDRWPVSKWNKLVTSPSDRAFAHGASVALGWLLGELDLQHATLKAPIHFEDGRLLDPAESEVYARHLRMLALMPHPLTATPTAS